MQQAEQSFWRKCSACKKEINFSSKYYICSVSTCNGQRTGYVFCSVGCFERHLPGARHKDAGAIEKFSPSKKDFLASQSSGSSDTSKVGVVESSNINAGQGMMSALQKISGVTSSSDRENNKSENSNLVLATSGPVRRIPNQNSTLSSAAQKKLPREVLIIASRLKEYIQAKSEYNTSSSVMDVLSDFVRILCDRAIDNARAEGRKTVMDRDFDFLKNLK